MRELDVLLMQYVDVRYPGASPDEQAAFERLLTYPDPQILGLLTGRERSQDPALDAVVQQLLSHA